MREDLPRLMELYDAARAFMRSRGNTVQWTGGYPSQELIAAAIERGEQWVCVASDGIGRSRESSLRSWIDLPHSRLGHSSENDLRSCGVLRPCAPMRSASRACSLDGLRIVATFWFSVGPEPTYAEIEGGPGWLDDEPYGVVHRLASDGSVSGVGAVCLEWCLERCGNIRVDTHSSNEVMQRLLERLGYTRCGVITLDDGTPRDAFQKLKIKNKY